MFSFHKPKIYRSNLGCCICKAKSSSSRFTDSNKYENEFERCFRIQEKRSGEICNACVLLVKRWKKLSPENRHLKHWHHVVDARAGPGSKITGNRRLAGPSTTSVVSSSGNSTGDSHSTRYKSNASSSSSTEVLPLSSSNQTNSQTTGSSSSPMNTRKRTSSFSSKACAIDTNVSTFTFGEPARRNYMSVESSSSYLSNSSVSKPQSALNSSAFESVIKRFRQRQQQQQLEAQRRLTNRKQRQQRMQQNPPETSGKSAPVNECKNSSQTDKDSSESLSSNQGDKEPQTTIKQQLEAPVVNKRQKRSSESIGSLSVDGCRIATLLDASIWRKEKVCCGIIFRGLFNEVAVFPKLLKPCDFRRLRLNEKQTDETIDGYQRSDLCQGVKEIVDYIREDNQDLADQGLERQRSESPQPPPRATKSGSFSSSHSSTSGTGSMEKPGDDSLNSRAEVAAAGRRRLAGTRSSEVKRPTSVALAKRRQPRRTQRDQDSLSSSSSSAFSLSNSVSDNITGVIGGPSQGNLNSPGSSSSLSGVSSSRLMLLAEVDVDELMDLEDDDTESSTDAMSSVESLVAAPASQEQIQAK